ncbi:M20/M25/M40 family metallo-hydrolase [Nocardiopsis sp. MG754419]|uniref:M20/M25/M40 family metallo-hydrolase n=1 Tax=Nocardiopsis sp. MG754419 TaxID=2259865 RepID=UPI001BA82357|nr:M20/M25/M40 family metallo-hydrolase [Nocardiopsis sp. MG754419]MBR8743436.1 peptidase [Nocardiopsis sp. MG754419]
MAPGSTDHGRITDHEPTRAAGSTVRRISFAGLLLLLALSVFTLVDLRPPDPAPESAPASEFSAERAFAHVERIAVAPHPAGTAEHARVLDHVVGALDDLGLDPEVHESIGISPIAYTGTAPVGRVRNVVAVIEGTEPTGTILLAAHYDSVSSGPGANDDAVGVAAVLETARALTEADTPPRNDVVLLLTDAEEAGLLGAEAFTEDHPLGASDGVVLNHEARGAGGTVMLFRTTPGSGDLVRLFAESAPHPAGDSLLEELFAVMPNDTDFTAFREGGLTVLDFAYAGRGAYYHSALDTPENVDPRTLQQMGANTLAFSRALAAEDLTPRTVDGAGEPDLAYFNVPPGRLVHFPVSWALPLAAVALLSGVVLVAAARRRGLVTIPRVLASTLLTPVLLGAGAAVGLGFWQVLIAVRPGLARVPTGSPYEPVWLAVAAVLIGVALAALWFLLWRRWLGAHALMFGGLLVLGVFGVLVAAVAPGASSFLVLPVLAASGGGLIALVADPESPWRPVFWTVGLVPTAVLLHTAAWGTLEQGMAEGVVVTLPLLVAGLLLSAPLVDLLWPLRRAALVPMAALVTAAATAVAGLAVNTHDAARPLPARLAYTLDADTGTAVWAVPLDEGETEIAAADWAGGYVSEEVVDLPVPGLGWSRARVGEAVPVDLPAPELEVVADSEEDGERRIALELFSPRAAETIGLYFAEDSDRVREVTVEGREVRLIPDDSGRLGARFHAPRTDRPVEMELVVAPGPLRVTVKDGTSVPSALAEIPGYGPPPEEYFLLFSEVSVFTTHEL